MQPLRGMADLRAPDVYLWQHLEESGRQVLAAYGFTEIRTPLMESTDLFVRGIGDATDIVQKEMYRFEDQGGRDVCLRPEGTASVMRVAAGAGPDLLNARLYYIGPMFRYEKPQKGRYRQFHQIGVEALGEPIPAADAECIALQLQLLQTWGLKGARLVINSLGEPEDRERVLEGMRNALRPVQGELCEECGRRFDQNVLRILDCKNERCRQLVEDLPPLTEWMGTAAQSYLAEVRALLELLDIEAELEPRLVRGLDYYVHTVWEIQHPALGAQNQVCGGGRYRIAMEKNPIDGVGFALGMERVCLTLEAAGVAPGDLRQPVQVVLATQHESAFRENLVLAQTLRRRGIRCVMDLRGRSLKKQMREADKIGARWVVIRGEQEMDEGTFMLKDMVDGGQEALAMPDLMEKVGTQLSIQPED